MVLPDHQIRFVSQERGLIDPYTEEQLQPASYDVRLAATILVPSTPTQSSRVIDFNRPMPEGLYRGVDISDGHILRPGQFILGSTIERVRIPNDMVGRIEGKSSIGRLGLTAHITAGYLDPGFHGNITLEIVNLFPRAIRLRPGQRIAQLGFEWMSTSCERQYGSPGLSSHYQDADGVEGTRYGAIGS